MKKGFAVFVVLLLALTFVLPAYAADGKVTYDGNAQQFVFEPGSGHSLTDLFPNFKGVMPGDSLTQKITVKNDASKEVKVKIYIRSLGAHEDSAQFLSQLSLQVQKSEDNQMAYMFDAAADQTAQLTDWVLLGTLYSGGEVNLDVTLNVPVELDNEFRDAIGYLDWEFMVEELPVEESDPNPPITGDDNSLVLYSVFAIGALSLIIILLVWRKKDEEKEAKGV